MKIRLKLLSILFNLVLTAVDCYTSALFPLSSKSVMRTCSANSFARVGCVVFIRLPLKVSIFTQSCSKMKVVPIPIHCLQQLVFCLVFLRLTKASVPLQTLLELHFCRLEVRVFGYFEFRIAELSDLVLGLRSQLVIRVESLVVNQFVTLLAVTYISRLTSLKYWQKSTRSRLLSLYNLVTG